MSKENIINYDNRENKRENNLEDITGEPTVELIPTRDSTRRAELTRSSTFDASKGRPGPALVVNKNPKKSTLPLPRRHSRSKDIDPKRNSLPPTEFSQ